MEIRGVERNGEKARNEDLTPRRLLTLRELYPSKEALDDAGTGAADALNETFAQLDQLLVALG